LHFRHAPGFQSWFCDGGCLPHCAL